MPRKALTLVLGSLGGCCICTDIRGVSVPSLHQESTESLCDAASSTVCKSDHRLSQADYGLSEGNIRIIDSLVSRRHNVERVLDNHTLCTNYFNCCTE